MLEWVPFRCPNLQGKGWIIGCPGDQVGRTAPRNSEELKAPLWENGLDGNPLPLLQGFLLQRSGILPQTRSGQRLNSMAAFGSCSSGQVR